MCSSNVHYEHFLDAATPSSSRQPLDAVRSMTQARLAGASTLSSVSLSPESLLSHTINHDSSVLSVAVDEHRNILYSGSQEGYINVWHLDTFQSTARLSGHSASVLALELAPEKNWLFSSSGDNTVRVWDTLTNTPLFVVLPAEDSVGDIFALRWSSKLETLYLGCQSTSIQWICMAGFGKHRAVNGTPAGDEVGEVGKQFTDVVAGGPQLDDAPTGTDSPIISTPDMMTRPHRFFDSVSVALSRSAMGTTGNSTPTRPRLPATSTSSNAISTLADRDHATSGPLSSAKSTEKVLHAASRRLDDAAVPSAGIEATEPETEPAPDAVRMLLIPSHSSVPSAHFGYIYSLALLTLEGDAAHPTVLASGSGDETIKLWHATRHGLSLLATLESPNADGNAVLALASWKTTLFSGLQGGEVEVWDLETCTLVRTIRAHTDDVICLEACVERGLLWTGGADGTFNTWDRSFRCVNKVQAHEGIVLAMAKIRAPEQTGENKDDQNGRLAHVTQLVTGSSDNCIKIWDVPHNRPDAEVEARRRDLERLSLATTPTAASAPILSISSPMEGGAEWPVLRSLLRKFISIPSISSTEEHAEDCRQAAHFLKTCFQELGAEARIVANSVVGRNPLVLATFKANAYRSRRRRRTAAAKFDRSRSASSSTSTSTTASTDSSESSYLAAVDRDDEALAEEEVEDAEDDLSGSIMFDQLAARDGVQDGEAAAGEGRNDADRASRQRRKKRCLFYGHYDCIAAEGSWTSDPFSLDGRDGYLYGRGVSDNKGPVLAAACAVHQLLSTRRLYSDVVFLIEGEEENGSAGFVEAVRRYKPEIGAIDVVLLSNSYWLDEDTPCLTVGLRGVVRATVSVASGERDVHSGVEGGAIREPMVDMVKLLARLTGEGEKVALPGFYDSVRPTTQAELAAFADIVRIKQSQSQVGVADTVQSLMAKWRLPSLSVHNIRVSGPGNSTVIPSSVSAQVSLRLVPDQDLPTIEKALIEYVTTTFDALYPSSTRNKVAVSVDHRADWWLGSDSSQYFHLLREAVRQEWNAEPISIREGGSIPAIAILEKELGAKAVHLPMGQSSDNAHLPNERIRLTNLVKGQNVVTRFVQGLAHV